MALRYIKKNASDKNRRPVLTSETTKRKKLIFLSKAVKYWLLVKSIKIGIEYGAKKNRNTVWGIQKIRIFSHLSWVL